MSHDQHSRKVKEQRDGIIWIVSAGAFAVALWGFLVFVDHTLSTSDKEQRLGERLKELRTAQALVGSGVSDARQAPELGHTKELEPAASIDTLVSLDAPSHGHGAHHDAHSQADTSHSGAEHH